jgi:hypothetical protein
MPRRKLTLEDQLKGVTNALSSPKTPKQLRPGLEKRAEALRQEIATQKPRSLSQLFGMRSARS